MHTQRIAATLLALSGSAVAATAVPATAETGPKCADIVDGNALYDDTGVHARMLLAAPACKGVTYTLYVSDGTTTTTRLATATGTPTTTAAGDPAVTFDTAVTDPTSTDGVCLYVTTSRGRHVFDRAPDTGCIDYTLNGEPPLLKYR